MPRRLRLGLAAWALAVSGDTSLAAWAAAAVEALLVRYARNEQTAATVAADARRLFRYLQAMGVTGLEGVTCELVTRWCWAARPDRLGRLGDVSAATARQRQWIALVCFEELVRLGAPIGATALIGPRIQRSGMQVSARPLNPGEAGLVRAHADSGLVTSRRPLQVAFAFASGTATEIAALRMGDIDLAASTVTFSGDAARTNPLDGWSIETFRRWLRSQPQDPRQRRSGVRQRRSGPRARGAFGQCATRRRAARGGPDGPPRRHRALDPAHHRSTGTRRARHRSRDAVPGGGVA